MSISDTQAADATNKVSRQRKWGNTATVNGRPTARYEAWRNMIRRCTWTKHPDYYNYGGRGITVCPEWLASFDRFCIDVGPRPPKMTLERRNNDLGYSKDNCYWATRKQQAATRRLGNQGKHSHQSRLLTFNGKTQSIGAWSAELGAKPHSTTLHKRLDRYGWSIAKALTTPIRAWRNNDEPAVPKIGPKPAEVNFGSALVKEDAA